MYSDRSKEKNKNKTHMQLEAKNNNSIPTQTTINCYRYGSPIILIL